MDQAEPKKEEDNSSPQQKRDEGSGIGVLVFCLVVAFIYVAWDRGWKITFNSGEAAYCRDVRQKVDELCAEPKHDECVRWQAEFAKCRTDHH
ncbi:MAG TPA: hypothetical protein VL625_11515 [Patescibacteria group bacterium]|nr:hypothetical protein [Patescibacteria group bacterium]